MKLEQQKLIADLLEAALLLTVVVATTALLAWLCKDFAVHPLVFDLF